MAIDDIDFLYKELPESFEIQDPPLNLAEDWIIIPVDSLEKETPFDITEQTNTVAPPPSLEGTRSPVSDKQLPIASGCFPGGPKSSWPKEYFPPPDALAFYLPFHYFYSDWWGIYLTIKGIYILGKYIYEKRSDILTLNNSMIASQVFLYGHEAYHHNVESFATRLETSHRTPLYKKGFQRIYQDTVEHPAKCTLLHCPVFGEMFTLKYTWSCGVNGEEHCGKCIDCVARKKAFVDAGVKDPTLYKHK